MTMKISCGIPKMVRRDRCFDSSTVVIGSETSPHAMLFNLCRPLIEFLRGQSSNVLFCGGNSLESLEELLADHLIISFICGKRLNQRLGGRYDMANGFLSQVLMAHTCMMGFTQITKTENCDDQ